MSIEHTRQQEWIMDDIYKRASSAQCDKKLTLLRPFLKNRYVSMVVRSAFYRKLSGPLFQASKTGHRNKCRVCGRSHYVISKAGLARLQLRFFGGQGLLRGLGRYGR